MCHLKYKIFLRLMCQIFVVLGVDPIADADTSEPSNTSTDTGDHSSGNERLIPTLLF